MKSNLRYGLISLLFVFLFSMVSFGQATTGSIEGTLRDPNGAVIPNATVTATNEQRTYTATTNDGGEYQISNLSPGVYNVEAAATGFGTLRREKVTVEIESKIQVNFDMKVAGAVVGIEVIADEPLVDVSSSKTATNITKEKIDLLPKGLRFSSVIEVAPGVRNEPKSNGFQIDGASGSENVSIVDGLEVTRTFGGSLGSTKNVPLDFLQEVQVKSAGYEAEFGGALGGVITVTSRAGGNEFHGGFKSEFENDAWNSRMRPLRRYSRQGLASAPAVRIPEYYISPDLKDTYTLFAPSLILNGPIWRDRVWFSAGYAPEYTHVKRTIRRIAPVTATTITPVVLDRRDVTTDTKNDNMYARIDATPIKNLSVYVSAFNTPSRSIGVGPAATINQGAYEFPQAPPAAGVTPSGFFDPRLSMKGGYTPANAVSGQAVYTAFGKLLLSLRLGRNYLNDKGGNYDVDSSNPVWSIVSPCGPPIVGCPSNTTSSATFGVANAATKFDITTRRYLAADATLIQRLAGQQHTFKGGFQRTAIENNVDSGNGGGVSIFYNQPNPVTNQSGPFGYYTIAQTGVIGRASSTNDAWFIQDGWQVHPRLTLNLGLRLEKETVPAWGFGGTALPAAIEFGYGDKLAPRIGGAFDVFGDGKLKIYGSFSIFFDTMKYDLPRGSFGGETQIIEYRGLDTHNFMSINLANRPGALFARQDQRTVSTSPYVLGNRTFLGIDPNLKPAEEQEYTIGGDYAWRRDVVFGVRFTRKELKVAVDDVGIPSEHFENYCICNPGFGESIRGLQAFGYPGTNKAVRNYTGLEFKVDKRFSNNWYVNATYLWSRLFGNYSGLASSDESGRGNPNVNRFFDVPWINLTASGKYNDGLLATDRPHTFKAFGSYRFGYDFLGKRMETDISLSQYIYQGTPISSNVQIQLNGTLEDGSDCTAGGCNHGVAMFVNGRGDLGRTKMFTQTDGLLVHKFFITEKVAFRFGMNVINVLNQAVELDRSSAIIRANTPSIANEYNAPVATLQYGSVTGNTLSQAFNLMVANIANFRTQHAATLAANPNPFYNQPILWQGPRVIRFSAGIQF